MACIKLILGLFFIVVIAVGSVLFGWSGFIFTFIVAFVISSMISKIEKDKNEKTKYKEILAAIEKANGKNY